MGRRRIDRNFGRSRRDQHDSQADDSDSDSSRSNSAGSGQPAAAASRSASPAGVSRSPSGSAKSGSRSKSGSRAGSRSPAARSKSGSASRAGSGSPPGAPRSRSGSNKSKSRSRSGSAKSGSRSPVEAANKSRSGSPEQKSRSGSPEHKSRSGSPHAEQTTRSKSGSPEARSKSGSRARSKSGSPARSKSGSHARSKSGSPARSKSGSPARSKSESPARSKSGSRARSKSGSPAKSKSGSPARSKSGSPAKSKSGSPAREKSRSRSDLYETMNTLRFANRAKELVSKPVPAFMLQQQANSSSKKRKYDGGLGEGTTPKPRFNHTIGTSTPSKTKKHNLAGYKRQLNLTAPEKRYPTCATSTLSKMAEESPDATLSNLSGISMIKGPEEDVSMMSTSSRPQDYSDESMMRGGAGVWGMEQTNVENKTLNMTDILALMSPMMRQMKETIEKSVKEGIAQYQQQQNQPKESALVLDITPPRKAKNTPRMTSSPIRRTPLRKAAMTPSRTSAMTSSQHTLGGGINERIDETDGVLKDVTNAALFSDDEEMVKTDNKASNNTNDKQINVIPEIPEYESPASTARNPQQPQIQQQPQQIQAQQPQIHNIQQQLNYSPTIEEMERSLGIGPDSPLALFCGPSTDNFNPPPPRPPGERKKSRRSTRRTSVFGSELEQSLQFIRNSTADIRARRMSNIRPTRAAAQGVFYGSPKSRKDKENTDVVVPESVTEPSNVVQHPLFNKNAFTVDPARQRAHNDSILTLLNTGSLKLLTALPAIGPKTGCILHGYRTLNGGIKTIQEIETINGLGQKFYKKFLIQNQIVLDEETSV